MAKKKEHQRAAGPLPPRRIASAAGKGRKIVRKLATGTLLAAGIAVTQLGVAEVDSRFRLFDHKVVDRLHAPITRYHD